MKKFLLPFLLLFTFSQAFAVVARVADVNLQEPSVQKQIDKSFIPEGLENLNTADFLAISPKTYKKRTGKGLGLKNRIKLKIAQKALQKEDDSGSITKGLYILLAFFALGWLAIGLLDDWDGDRWIICLVLTLLGWLPGFIYALVVMDNYF